MYGLRPPTPREGGRAGSAGHLPQARMENWSDPFACAQAWASEKMTLSPGLTASLSEPSLPRPQSQPQLASWEGSSTPPGLMTLLCPKSHGLATTTS